MDGTHAIGLDLGGTKILAGVVARDGAVDQPPRAADAARLAGRAAGGDRRGNRGAPCWTTTGSPRSASASRRRSTRPRGRVFVATNIPLADVDLRDRMHDRSASRSGSTTTRTRPRSASGRPAPARGATDMVMLTLGTGVGGGSSPAARRFAAAAAPGSSSGTSSSSRTGRRARACAPAAATSRSFASGRGRDRGRARGVRPCGRRSPPRPARERGRRDGEGDPRPDRRPPRRRDGLVREHLQPGADRARRRLRRRRVGPPDAVGRDGVAARGDPRPRATWCSVVRAELGTAAGLIGAAFVAFEALDRPSADAARRLRDADREPRGRDPARARASCATPTSCSARTRATRAGCSIGTGSGRGSSRTTSTTRRRGRRSSCRGSRRGSGSRSSPTRACRRSPTRARGSCAPRSTRACR